jgi:hypothetical protein
LPLAALTLALPHLLSLNFDLSLLEDQRFTLDSLPNIKHIFDDSFEMGSSVV